MLYPTSPPYSTSSPREYLPAPLTQRQRIAAMTSELRRRDKVAHAALRWEITNNLDNLDVVERIVLDALTTLDAAEQAHEQQDLANAGCN